jgi:predicted nucleotidyltransferase
MYRRLNITLPHDVLARADAFAKRERYTRSALIAAALDAFVSDDRNPREARLVREPAAVYAPEAVGINPAIRAFVPDIIDACRRHGAVYAALVGSSTQPDPVVRPADLDLLVRFPQGHPNRARSYLDLLDELRTVTGLPVDLIEVDAVRNERLRREFERTQVVLYEAA